MAKAKAKKLAYCHDCFKKLTVGKTKDEKRFLAAELVSWGSKGETKFRQGKCSGCGMKGEVIFY